MIQVIEKIFMIILITTITLIKKITVQTKLPSVGE
jgi:hypothetical protein